MISQERKSLPHFFAALGTIGVLTLLPFFFYLILVFATNDIGGPLNFVLVPCLNFIVASLFTLVLFFPLSILLDKLLLKVNRDRSNKVNPVLLSGIALVLIAVLVVGGFCIAVSSLLVNHFVILIFDLVLGERDINAITLWLFRFIFLGGVPFLLGNATYWFLLQVCRKILSSFTTGQRLNEYIEAG